LIFFDSRSIGKHRLVKFTDQFAVADTDANMLQIPMPIPTTYFLIRVVPIQNLKSLTPHHQNHQQQINSSPIN